MLAWCVRQREASLRQVAETLRTELETAKLAQEEVQQALKQEMDRTQTLLARASIAEAAAEAATDSQRDGGLSREQAKAQV